MREEIVFGLNDLQGSLALVQLGEVFLDRVILDQERDERALATPGILEAGNEFTIIRDIHAIVLKLFFHEFSHLLSRFSSV